MTKKYKPCEHRHGSRMLGAQEPEYYDTPCPHCEAEEKFVVWLVVGVLVVFALLALWWLA